MSKPIVFNRGKIVPGGILKPRLSLWARFKEWRKIRRITKLMKQRMAEVTAFLEHYNANTDHNH